MSKDNIINHKNDEDNHTIAVAMVIATSIIIIIILKMPIIEIAVVELL